MAERVLPGLNPYQPNQRMSPPVTAMVRSCGSMGAPPSRLNLRPRRGPRTMAPGQRDESADGVNYGRSGEIMETHAQRGEEVAVAAHVGQPAVRPQAQCPMMG